MGDNSKIEWTDASWNPVTGCTKVSQGCKHCYAETLANRMWATQYPPNADGSPREFTDVRLHPDRLEQPLRWRRPRRIFVNSMSDLFHEAIPSEFIAECFGVMAQARQHTFQVLTKRPERMCSLLSDKAWMERVDTAMGERAAQHGWCVDEVEDWPLPNVWLGVSVEDHATAEQRVPLLLDTLAAIRFLSCEPLLGPVDLDKLELVCATWRKGFTIGNYLDWVIAGGESGAGARPMHPDWARGLRDQCEAAGVPFFFKQWGANMPQELTGDGPEPWRRRPDGSRWWALDEMGKTDLPQVTYLSVGKKMSGRLLDGRTWDEYPAVPA